MANLIFGELLMNKLMLGVLTVGFLSNIGYAKNVEQTICFSQDENTLSSGTKYHSATLGDNVTLNGGKCQGKTLPQMNKKDWKVIQVVTGLNRAFGMVMER